LIQGLALKSTGIGTLPGEVTTDGIRAATVDPVLATRSGAGSTEDSPAIEQEDLTKLAAQDMLVEVVWTKPYLAYLLRGELPEDAVHRRQIMRRSKAFTIIQGELYKHSTTGVLQR
jgi:hypothetical protein